MPMTSTCVADAAVSCHSLRWVSPLPCRGLLLSLHFNWILASIISHSEHEYDNEPSTICATMFFPPLLFASGRYPGWIIFTGEVNRENQWKAFEPLQSALPSYHRLRAKFFFLNSLWLADWLAGSLAGSLTLPPTWPSKIFFFSFFSQIVKYRPGQKSVIRRQGQLSFSIRAW